MSTNNIKTESGCTSKITIFDDYVIGETLTKCKEEIPTKLGSLLVCHLMIKNDTNEDFVKWINIENDVLTWKAIKLDVNLKKYYDLVPCPSDTDKLKKYYEPVVNCVFGSYNWLDVKAVNCGFYLDKMYCFDIMYCNYMKPKYLRQLELAFNLETGILNKYNNLVTKWGKTNDEL